MLAVAIETGWIVVCQVNPPVGKNKIQSSSQAPAIAMSADGRLLLEGERTERILAFWDVPGRENVAGIFSKSASACSAVAISPAGNAAVGVFTRQDIDQSSLSIYMLPATAPGQPVWNRQTRPESDWTPGLVMAAVFSPDGRHLALAGSKGVSLLDVATRQSVPSFQFASSASRVAYAPAGDLLAVATPAATAAPQGRLVLLDAATGSEQASLDNPAAEITAIAFSSDGKHLVGGDAAGELLIWDVATRQLVVRIRAARAPDSQLSFTREGNRLLAVVNGVATLFELNALIARDQRLQSTTFEFLPTQQ
ncbi:MAG: WD40 repeat domain-containing protein [Pirellulales bacterium]